MGTFYLESGSKRLLFVAKTLLSGQYPQWWGSLLKPEGSAKDNDAYAKGSSREDDIDTEGGGEEDSFDTEGSSGQGTFNMEGGGGEHNGGQDGFDKEGGNGEDDSDTKGGNGLPVWASLGTKLGNGRIVSENNFDLEVIILKEQFGYTELCWKGCSQGFITRQNKHTFWDESIVVEPCSL